MENCVFAGTFDPITKGHEDIIKKCLKRFDKVFVVIGENKNKTPFFGVSERLEIVKATFESEKNVTVVEYGDCENYGEFLKRNGIKYYVRGIRNEVDLQFEKEYEVINKKLYPFVETVYLTAEKEFEGVSSTMVKRKITEGKGYTEYIPEKAINTLEKILKRKKTD